MRAGWTVLAGAALIAASILFIGRWQISAIGYGYKDGDDDTTKETVYRLDRWTGQIESCFPNMNQNVETEMKETGLVIVKCRYSGAFLGALSAK